MYFLPYGIDGGPEGKVGREELKQEHVSLEPGTHVSVSPTVATEINKIVHRIIVNSFFSLFRA